MKDVPLYHNLAAIHIPGHGYRQNITRAARYANSQRTEDKLNCAPGALTKNRIDMHKLHIDLTNCPSVQYNIR